MYWCTALGKVLIRSFGLRDDGKVKETSLRSCVCAAGRVSCRIQKIVAIFFLLSSKTSVERENFEHKHTYGAASCTFVVLLRSNETKGQLESSCTWQRGPIFMIFATVKVCAHCFASNENSFYSHFFRCVFHNK